MALEFSYDLVPRNNIGLSSYVSYTYSIAKPNGSGQHGRARLPPTTTTTS